jgi:CheY-like chemotaxis protein
MREFYRPREPQLTLARIDLNAIIPQVIDLTRVRWRDLPQERGAVIDLQTQFDPNLSTIQGAESEIRDALTNLIFNAVDAMPEGGRLIVRTRCSSVSSASGVDADTRVLLEVIDSGIGMSEETRQRCLEPFFTTKGERGTGLGLGMVYGMAQRHSAELEIESTLGKGTTMRLIFLAAEVGTGETSRQPTPRLVEPLRILIVDDDPLIIESLSEALRGDGHHVTAADGGQAGIDTFKAAHMNDESFQLVITDLGMPYVDGRRVAAAVKGTSPATPVVLLTGWGQRLIAENEVPAYVDRVLNKPPKLRELRAALAELATAI